MANPLVIPAGKTGVFSHIRDPRVTHLGIPLRKKVLVLETSPGMADLRAQAMITEIAEDNQVQRFVANGDVTGLVSKLSRFNPDIVFLPHPDSPFPQNQALIKTAVSCLPNKIVFHYETPDMHDFFNLYVLFDEAGMEHKMRCIAPFKSQLERVRFDLAAKYAARQAALEIQPFLLPDMQKYKYAERFVMAGLLPNDPGLHLLPGKRKVILTPDGSWAIWGGLKTDFFSPHHDDLEIPAAFIISELARRSSLVHNYVLTTGKEGVAGDASWILKHLIRHQELAEASRLEGVVPIDLALLHDAPENRPQPEWQEGAGMIFTGFFRRFNPRLIFLPLEHDGHPDHQLTFKLITKIAQQALDNGYWTMAGFPNVLLYASPWYSGIHGTNTYFWFDKWEAGRDEASKYASMVSAIVGTELAMNRPGENPPKPQDFGGKYAERFLIQRF